MRIHYLILSLYISVSFSACRPAPPPPAWETAAARDSLTRALQGILDEQQLMGLSVLVLADSQVVYARGFGLADSARQLPATDRTIYRLASISKSVTATALMLLYDEGKVDLDADVSSYLGFPLRNPRFPEIPITLRQLLSHRSSIVDGTGYAQFSAAMFDRPLSLDQLFVPGGAYYTDDLFLDHPPGSFFTYANCPWGLIASVVERLSGERFDRFCRRRIFEPLRMDASFNVQDLTAFDSLAVLYRAEQGVWVPQADDYRGVRPAARVGDDYVPGSNGLLFGPQGSLRCSVTDLARFLLLHLREGEYDGVRLLRPETARLMHSAQWTYDGNNGDTYHDFFFSWGLGFHRLTNRDSLDVLLPGRPMFGHPGEAYGLISDMYVDPASGLGVIFATNGSRQPYAVGQRSTFYLPEERVFGAVREFWGE